MPERETRPSATQAVALPEPYSPQMVEKAAVQVKLVQYFDPGTIEQWIGFWDGRYILLEFYYSFTNFSPLTTLFSRLSMCLLD